MKTFFSLSIAALSLAATPALADRGATADWARVVEDYLWIYNAVLS